MSQAHLYFTLNDKANLSHFNSARLIGAGSFDGGVKPTYSMPVHDLEANEAVRLLSLVDGNSQAVLIDAADRAFYVNPCITLYAGKFEPCSLDYLKSRDKDCLSALHGGSFAIMYDQRSIGL